jgi:hypothetical protein
MWRRSGWQVSCPLLAARSQTATTFSLAATAFPPSATVPMASTEIYKGMTLQDVEILWNQ